MSNPCAWCEKEKGIKTRGSHGICDYHKRLLVKQLAEIKKKKKAKK